MDEIKLNMENLTKEEREQLLKLIEKANKQDNKIWKPEDGDIYYFIDSYGDIYYCTWGSYVTNSEFGPDSSKYALGNCFKTKEEAEFALERRKVITELERFAKENNNPKLVPYQGYHLVCACGEVKAAAFAGAITFTDICIAEKAIETIGKDRLKKYYFGIEE